MKQQQAPQIDVQTVTTTEIRDANTKPKWIESPFFQTMERLRPWLQWAMVGLFALGSIYLYNRDVSAEQTVSLADLQRTQAQMKQSISDNATERKQDIAEVRSSMVTKELFDERTQAIKERLDTIDQRNKEILDHLPIRNP